MRQSCGHLRSGGSCTSMANLSGAELQVYSLEEIVAEKLRALLQQADLFEKTRLEPFTSPGLLRPLASTRVNMATA